MVKDIGTAQAPLTENTLHLFEKVIIHIDIPCLFVLCLPWIKPNGPLFHVHFMWNHYSANTLLP